MPRLPQLAAGALIAGVLFVSACGRDNNEIKIRSNGSSVDHASIARRDSLRPLGIGDVRIATTDSAVEIALVGDSLFAGLGEATRAKIARATDTAAVSGTGIGAGLEKLVKSTVAGALDHELHVPLSEISNIEYSDGTLVFYDKKGKRMQVFDNDNGRNRPSQFSRADADAFISAFKAKTSGA